MAVCPKCEKDFSQPIQQLVVIPEQKRVAMWICPFCQVILGFSSFD